MDAETRRCLELDLILEGIRKKCRTQAAGESLAALHPCLSREELRERRSPVASVLAEIGRGRTPPLGNLPDPRPVLAHLSDDRQSLNGLELRFFGEFLLGNEDSRDWLLQSSDPALNSAARLWPTFHEEAQLLTRRLTPEGELDPERNPTLAALVAAMSDQRRKREVSARKLLNDPELQGFWQDTTYSAREERLVLPLKTDFRGKVPGLVHHASGSGQTLFVEPFELVDLNNELVRLGGEYQAEAARLLREFTHSLKARLEDAREAFRLMVFWDMATARASWGAENEASFPAAEGNTWKLLRARHPLLGRSAVGVSLHLPEGTRGVVLSGPNTGGKTVFLKTMAVMAYLNQIGCPIPADPDSSLPIVADIAADIGDRQSISEALSTYSAHLLRLKDILQTAGPGTLVLLDELGTGTDPAEGGALGVAILEELRRLGAFVLTTTHTATVKQFPLQFPDFMNASMEFDVATGRPTYAVVTGHAGTSRAVETAERLGLPASVVRRAKEFLESSRTQAERRLAALDSLEEDLRSRRAVWQEREDNELRLREKRQAEYLRWQEEKAEWESGKTKERERLLAEQRRDFENLVKTIRESQAGKKEILDTRSWLEDQAKQLRQSSENLSVPLQAVKFDGKAGDQAYYQGKRVFLEKRAREGYWRVKAGVMSLEVPESELEEAKPEKHTLPSLAGDTTRAVEKAVFQLDLRGERAEEAKNRLERQIDRALVDGLSEFSVIHGLGEGKLQKAVRELLGRHPHVREFFYATPEEGGFGKTIVRL